MKQRVAVLLGLALLGGCDDESGRRDARRSCNEMMALALTHTDTLIVYASMAERYGLTCRSMMLETAR